MNIAILFGGSSYEHEISIVSAITMKKVLQKSQLTFIFVDQNREFYLVESAQMQSKHFSSGAYRKNKKLSLKKGGFYIGALLGEKKITFDTALNLIHGRDGEDGKIASLMEFYEISFISPRLEASVLSYNKLYTKLFAQSIGVKTLPYEHLTKNGNRTAAMPYPLIVKPVRLGSSIGVSIVRDAQGLEYALDVAFEFDNDVIVEPFLEGVKEYNQAGCKTDEWELSIIEEPHKEEFLDFEKKYMDFSRDGNVLAAQIDEGLAERIQENFKKIYDPLFLGSLIRCDFFVYKGEVILNEINPIPGSMANYLFENFEGVLTRLAGHLPKEKPIAINYDYIHSIQNAKGKA